MSSALRTARGSPGTGSRCRSRPLRGRDGRAGSKCGRLGEGGRGKLSALAQTLTGDSRALRGARRQGGRGRDEALVPGCRPAGRSRRPTRPRSRGRRRSFYAGPAAVERFLEFFAARIANDRAPTGGSGCRRSRRSTWRRTSRRIRGSYRRLKQHRAAIRALCDWLVVPPSAAREPGGFRAGGAEARRDEGRDPGPDTRGDAGAPRPDRYGDAGRVAGPWGAPERDGLQLRDLRQSS